MTERRKRVAGINYEVETTPWAEINNTPEELMKSSLLMTVGLIEVLRGRLTHDRPISLPPSRHSTDLATIKKLASTHEGATLLIKNDPIYEKLWRPWLTFTTDRIGRALTTGYNAHARFLAAPDVTPAAKVFAATPYFLNYVGELIHNGSPGHYFYRILNEIKDGNMDKVAALSNHLYSFARWDETLGWLQDEEFWPPKPEQTTKHPENLFTKEYLEVQAKRVESAIQASDRFKKVSGELFNIIVDSSDNSPFRKFVLRYFPALQMAVCTLFDTESYDPKPELERIQNLFQQVPEDKWAVFANYITVSQSYFYKTVKSKVDKQILQGKIVGAETLVAYHKRFQENEGPFLTFTDNEKEALEYWADLYAQGKITDDELLRVPGNVRGVTEAKKKLLETITSGNNGFKSILSDHLNNLRTSPTIILEKNIAVALLENGYYPTDEIVRFINSEGVEAGFVRLQELRKATEDGKFNPQNPVQRDLQFLEYLKLAGEGPTGNADYDSFQQVAILKNDPEKQLNPKHIYEAEAATFESALVYWQIKKRAERGRRIAVIGNLRYGDNFVTRPLEDELAQLDGQVTFHPYKIPSSGIALTTIPDIFSMGFKQMIDSEKPDVFVIDGTHNSRNGVDSRFPSAMIGYLNWFLAYNSASTDYQELIANHEQKLRQEKSYKEFMKSLPDSPARIPYSISHWTPEAISDQVWLGNLPMARRVLGYEGPEVIFVNPIIVEPDKYPGFPRLLVKHTPGFLDDPEKVERESEIVFTETGVKKVKLGMLESQFVLLVQDKMSSILPHMIRLTDPVNT